MIVEAPGTMVYSLLLTKDQVSWSSGMRSRILPDDFEPTSKDIICGRDGTSARRHTGNRRLYVVAAMNLKAYCTAQTTTEKNKILSAIVDGLRESSPSGGFVEKGSKTGKWMTVDNKAARAKVGNVLRDALPAALKLQPKKTAEDTDRQRREDTEARTLKAQEHCLAYALGKHDLKSPSDCLQEESPECLPNGFTGGFPRTAPHISPHGLQHSVYPEGSLHAGLPIVLPCAVAIPKPSPKYSKPYGSVNISGLPVFLKHSYAISRKLPDGFKPSDCDVICGDGINTSSHVGNGRFAALVATNLKAYSRAKTKTEQTRVVSFVVDRMRRLSPNGCFVKINPKTGKWMTVDDGSARDKVELAFHYALKASMNHLPTETKRQGNRTTQDADTQRTKDKAQQGKRDLNDTPSGCWPGESPKGLPIDYTCGSPKISHSLKYPSPNAVPLPHGFIPSDVDVICGRVGKSAQQHPGNQSFRAIIARNLKAYSDALTKTDKSYVVQEVVDQMRKRSPSGGFVKKDSKTGKWIAVDETTTRAKVGHSFRDSLTAATKTEAGKEKGEHVFKEPQSPPCEDSSKWDDPQIPAGFSSSAALVMDFPFKAFANGNYSVFRMNGDAPGEPQPHSTIGTTATNPDSITSQISTQANFGPVNRVENATVYEARNKIPHREFAVDAHASGQLDVLAMVASLLPHESKPEQKLPASRGRAIITCKPRETQASNCEDNAPGMPVGAEAAIQKAHAIRAPARISWTSQTTQSIDDDTLSYSSSVDDDDDDDDYADSISDNSTQLEASLSSPGAFLATQQASLRKNHPKWSSQVVGANSLLGTSGSPSKKRRAVEEGRNDPEMAAVKRMRLAKPNDRRNTPEKGSRNGVGMESNGMDVRSQPSEEDESRQWLDHTRPSSTDGNIRSAATLPPRKIRCVPLREPKCPR
jgi:hypothetical protein